MQQQISTKLLFTSQEIKELPDPSWVVDDAIEAAGLAMLYGPPGVGKSFIALDLALHIAEGLPWLGRDTTRGAVIYVVTEGINGVRLRLEAWQQTHGLTDSPAAFFAVAPIQLRQRGEVERLLQAIDALGVPVKLIVFDTFARCFDGDENQAQEVGEAIAQIDALKARTGATVLLVHHSTKTGDYYRGSSALAGAMDTMLQVTKKDGKIALQNTKQKNAEQFETIDLRLNPVHLNSEFDGQCRQSCVVVPAGKGSGVSDDRREALLEAIVAAGGFPSWADWKVSVESALNQKLAETTVRRDRELLVALGQVRKVGKSGWEPVFAATANGEPTNGGETWPIPIAANPTPLFREGGAAMEAGQ